MLNQFSQRLFSFIFPLEERIVQLQLLTTFRTYWFNKKILMQYGNDSEIRKLKYTIHNPHNVRQNPTLGIESGH